MSTDDRVRAAHAAWDRGRLTVAFKRFLALAEGGESEAWLNLGNFYANGIGTRRNRAKAMRWYRRAYRDGSGAAASNIATIYRNEGRPRMEAAWYRRAALIDDGDAAVELAKHFLFGSGVRKNRGHAAAYLKRALSTKFITFEGRIEARSLLRDIRRPRGASNYRMERP
jgi:hypothetical protein